MPAFIFPAKEKDLSFIVTWSGFRIKENTKVDVLVEDKTDRRLLGSFNILEEVKQGREFKDGGHRIFVRYRKVFWFIWGFEVTLDGAKLKGYDMNS